MTTKKIHVNRTFIAQNRNDGGDRPVYTVKEGSKNRYAREVIIHGPSRLVYDREGLKCGAKAYVETQADIELIDETTFKEITEKYSAQP